MLATDASGNVYMVTLGFNTGENLQVFKSTDGGVSFGPPANATPGFAGTGDFQDKPWMAINNRPGAFSGEIAVCWTRFLAGGGSEIRLAESFDGVNWFPSSVVNTGGQGCHVSWGFDPHGGGNTLYVSYYQGSGSGGQGDDNKIFMNTYNETGAAPGGPISSQVAGAPAKAHVQVADLLTTTTNGNLGLNGGARSNSFPHSAVNPANGDVYVIYNDNPADADNADVYLVKSRDAGATWSAPVQVNNDDAGREQFFPTLGVSGHGQQVMVGYYSRVDDPANTNMHRRGRIANVNTTTGAVTFGPTSFRMGPEFPSVIGQDPAINATYMGDYDQIVGAGAFFHSSWADNVTGNAFHAHQPDVRYARIAANRQNVQVGTTLTSTPSPVAFGSTLTYKAVLNNTGTATAEDVFMTLPLSSRLTFQSATAGCTALGRFVSCQVGSHRGRRLADADGEGDRRGDRQRDLDRTVHDVEHRQPHYRQQPPPTRCRSRAARLSRTARPETSPSRSQTCPRSMSRSTCPRRGQ